MSKLLWKIKMFVYDRHLEYLQMKPDHNECVEVDLQVAYGILTKDCEPKRCHCGCKEYKAVNIHHDRGHIAEFDAVCKECGKKISYWGYGVWNPFM